MRCIRCGWEVIVAKKVGRHWWCNDCISGTRYTDAFATLLPQLVEKPSVPKKLIVPRVTDIDIEEIPDESL